MLVSWFTAFASPSSAFLVGSNLVQGYSGVFSGFQLQAGFNASTGSRG